MTATQVEDSPDMPSTSSMISTCLRRCPSGPAMLVLVTISRITLDSLPVIKSKAQHVGDKWLTDS